MAVTVIVYVCKFSVLCDLFEDGGQQGTGTEHYEYSRETLLFLQTVKNSLVDHPFNDFPGEMKVTDNDRKDDRTDRRRTRKRGRRGGVTRRNKTRPPLPLYDCS